MPPDESRVARSAARARLIYPHLRLDPETAGHSLRVAVYSVELAKAVGLDDDGVRAIEWGALLHDIGKVAVPDHILRKATPLTGDEWLILRQHPLWGYAMLVEAGFLSTSSLAIVSSHHERWDGLGYPHGLAGEEIPFGARLFAVVDTYDAITSDRHYRRARSHRQALAELEQAAGTQLDPELVAVFRQLPQVDPRRLLSIG